jgi:RimJ/RimL family protein N-acetyltransferase
VPVIPDLAQPLAHGPAVLRDAAERDIPEILIAYQDDPELHIRLRQEKPPSGAQLGQRAENERARRAAGTQATLTILEPGSDVCRGQVDLHHVEWEHERAELGIWLAPHVRGKGMGTVALRLAGEWLLRNSPLERLAVTTEPDNEAMLRAAKAAGFTYEGVLRGYVRYRGKRADSAILSLLATDLIS